MSKQGTTANRKLPGRIYTLLVTVVATILVSTPVMFRMQGGWKAVAVVQHKSTDGAVAPKALIPGYVDAAAKHAGMPLVDGTATDRDKLVASLHVKTVGGGSSGEKRTSIEFQHDDQRQARQFADSLASQLTATVTDQGGTANAQATRITGIRQFSKGQFLMLLMYAAIMGFMTLFFPRPRNAAPKKKNGKSRLDAVSDAVGAPVIGSVFPAKVITMRRKSSNVPLRLTTFFAEIVVVLAFLLTLFNAATISRFPARMWKDPLGTYAQSVRTAGAQFQSLLNR